MAGSIPAREPRSTSIRGSNESSELAAGTRGRRPSVITSNSRFLRTAPPGASRIPAVAALKTAIRSGVSMSSRTAPARWARRSTTPSAACSSSCIGPGIAMASGRSRLTVASSPILASRPKKAAPGSAAPARSRASAMRSTTRAVTTASNSASLVGKCR